MRARKEIQRTARQGSKSQNPESVLNAAFISALRQTLRLDPIPNEQHRHLRPYQEAWRGGSLGDGNRQLSRRAGS